MKGLLWGIWIASSSVLASLPTSSLLDVDAWDNAFATGIDTATSNEGVSFSMRHPEMAAVGDELDRYAWHAHYWLRAYGLMAQVTRDSKYLDLGFELIDTIFYNTDRARFNRGELNISPYADASLEVAKRQWCRSHISDSHCVGRTPTDSNAVGMGWRRIMAGVYREEILNDGQIAQGMLRFLNLPIHDSRFTSYRMRALANVAKSEPILIERLQSWDYNLYTGVPGSFYYVRMEEPFADTLWGAPRFRFYSNPVPFNHSATMMSALLLLDSAKGSVTSEYRRMANSLMAFFKAHVRIVSSAVGQSYEWDYELTTSGSGQGVEDMGHGHVDMSFLSLALRFGVHGVDTADMELLANTYRRAYQGNGVFFEEMDATGTMASYDHYDMGYDWINVMEYTKDSTLLNIAKTTLTTQYSSSWARSMLMWANIMRWQKFFDGTLESTPVFIENRYRYSTNKASIRMYRLDGRKIKP